MPMPPQSSRLSTSETEIGQAAALELNQDPAVVEAEEAVVEMVEVEVGEEGKWELWMT